MLDRERWHQLPESLTSFLGRRFPKGDDVLAYYVFGTTEIDSIGNDRLSEGSGREPIEANTDEVFFCHRNDGRPFMVATVENVHPKPTKEITKISYCVFDYHHPFSIDLGHLGGVPELLVERRWQVGQKGRLIKEGVKAEIVVFETFWEPNRGRPREKIMIEESLFDPAGRQWIEWRRSILLDDIILGRKMGIELALYMRDERTDEMRLAHGISGWREELLSSGFPVPESLGAPRTITF